MQPDAQGKYPYTGSMDCALKTLKLGGPFKFYTGFPVYCVRIAPHVMVHLSTPPSLPPSFHVCVYLSFSASCLIRYGRISLMFLDLCIEFLLLNVCMCR
jgi:hypothetical protein